MMNLFIFLFLIPLSFAEKPPTCEELGSILQKQESELMGKNANGLTCAKLNAEDLMKLNDVDSSQLALVNEFKCQNLSVLEARIAKLQNEASLLQGFEKLKTHLKTQKDAAESAVPAEAQAGGMNFVDGVITAQSLELLVNTKTADAKSILEKLKAVPMDKRNTLSLFSAQLTVLCKGKPALDEGTVDACDAKYFKPNDEALAALNELINRGDHTKDQVDDWRSSLKIKKKDGTEYSFTKMSDDLKDGLAKIKDGSLTLSREELRVIRDLPDFESANGITASFNLRDIKTAAADQIPKEQFKFLVEDLKSRQDLEIQSKVSLTWRDYKSLATNFDASAKSSCDDAKNGYSSSQQCIRSLEQLIPYLSADNQGTLQSHLQQMVDSLKLSSEYRDSLTAMGDQCFSISSKTIKSESDLPEACRQKLNGDLSSKQNQVAALAALRKTIGDENADLINVRKFASQKFNSMNCGAKLESIVGECDADFKGEVSREVEALTSETMDILLVQNKPGPDIDIDNLCASDDKKITGKDRLCTFIKSTPDPVAKNDPKPPAPSSIGNADKGSNQAMSDAWINGLANFMGGLAQTFSPPVQAFNPYQSVGPVVNNIPPSLGISDSILAGAQARHGFGSYTAIGSPLFPRY